MKRVLLTALPLLLSSAVFAQPDPTAPGMGANPPEAQPFPSPLAALETPEKSVRYFLKALANHSELNLSLAVAGARTGFYGGDEWEDIRRDIYSFNMADHLKVDAISVDAQTDTEATVTVTGHSEFQNGEGRPIERGKSEQYTLQLRRETNPATPGFGAPRAIWRIVPLTNDEILAKPLYELPPLQLSASLVLRDPHLLPLLRTQRGLGQLKQLALGALQFVQDYDGVYAFDDGAHERALRPYLKNESLYTIATTTDQKWHFNDNLSGKSLGQINEMARMVMFYDGSAPDSDHLIFRFDDKTLIGYADGHCKALSKDELKDVLWTP